MTTHKFLLKQLAQQAGVSLATVDRVIHQRGGVSPQMVQRVQQAKRELSTQQQVLGLQGQHFIFDLLMAAPSRFCDAVTLALTSQLPALQPAVVRVRYHLYERYSSAILLKKIKQIVHRGSQGLIVKVPNTTEIASTLCKVQAQGVPVISLVTDLPSHARLSYVGMKNEAAGQTAAYLTEQWLPPEKVPHTVLLSLSGKQFLGEEERAKGFTDQFKQTHPKANLITTHKGMGLYKETRNTVSQILDTGQNINAVYSIGGANRAILDALENSTSTLSCFIGHDLDQDNKRLLAEKKLHAVLHHDLAHDMRFACEQLLSAHKIRLPHSLNGPANTQIITPFNLPSD